MSKHFVLRKDYFLCFRVIDKKGGLKLRNSFPIEHKSCHIRSSFCPLTSSTHGYASFGKNYLTPDRMTGKRES